jgi:hypothetical protein
MLLEASRQIGIHSFGFCTPIIVCEQHTLGYPIMSVGDNRLQRLNSRYEFDGNRAAEVRVVLFNLCGIAIDVPSPVDWEWPERVVEPERLISGELAEPG